MIRFKQKILNFWFDKGQRQLYSTSFRLKLLYLWSINLVPDLEVDGVVPVLEVGGELCPSRLPDSTPVVNTPSLREQVKKILFLADTDAKMVNLVVRVEGIKNSSNTEYSSRSDDYYLYLGSELCQHYSKYSSDIRTVIVKKN